MALGLQMNI